MNSDQQEISSFTSLYIIWFALCMAPIVYVGIGFLVFGPATDRPVYDEFGDLIKAETIAPDVKEEPGKELTSETKDVEEGNLSPKMLKWALIILGAISTLLVLIWVPSSLKITTFGSYKQYCITRGSLIQSVAIYGLIALFISEGELQQWQWGASIYSLILFLILRPSEQDFENRLVNE